jgi:hypothetical protein
VEEGGAAAGPLAGARVHPIGERAAVERPRGSAQAHDRHAVAAAGLRLKQAPHGGGSKPAQRRW